jgi:hypothetical protein
MIVFLVSSYTRKTKTEQDSFRFPMAISRVQVRLLDCSYSHPRRFLASADGEEIGSQVMTGKTVSSIVIVALLWRTE